MQVSKLTAQLNGTVPDIHNSLVNLVLVEKSSQKPLVRIEAVGGQANKLSRHA